MEKAVKFIYLPIGFCLIGYFIFLLFQGKLELEWLGIVLIGNAILFWLFPINVKNSEEKALKSAEKIFSNPVLAKDYLKEKGMTLDELEQKISKGILQAYEVNEILVIENN